MWLALMLNSKAMYIFLKTVYYVFHQHLFKMLLNSSCNSQCRINLSFSPNSFSEDKDSSAIVEITWGRALKNKYVQRISHLLKIFLTMRCLQVPEAGRSYKVKTVLLDYSPRSPIYSILSSFQYLRKTQFPFSHLWDYYMHQRKNTHTHCSNTQPLKHPYLLNCLVFI